MRNKSAWISLQSSGDDILWQLNRLTWVVRLHTVCDFDDAIFHAHATTIDGQPIAFHVLHTKSLVHRHQSAKMQDALQERFLRSRFDGEIRVKLFLHCGKLRRKLRKQHAH